MFFFQNHLFFVISCFRYYIVHLRTIKKVQYLEISLIIKHKVEIWCLCYTVIFLSEA